MNADLEREDSTTRAGRLPALASAAAALALLVAGCGGATVSTPGSAASASPAGPSLAASPSPAAAPSSAASPSSSPASSPAASSSVIGDTGTVEIAGEGFRITLPDGWRAIGLDQSSIDAITELFPVDSEIGSLLKGQAGSLALAGVKLFAIDPRPASLVEGVAPNLNVIVQPKPAGLSIELLGMVAQQQLEAIDAFSGVAIETVKLPAGPAVHATYAADQALADGSKIRAAGQQYYVTSETSLFIVTMTSGSSALDGTFDTMAESIQID
jgi:hypothetical protein